MATTIRMDECAPGMTAKLRAHQRQVRETTSLGRLFDPTTGALRPLTTHRLKVPSHDSRPGHRWTILVSWRPGWVEAWHQGQGCLAYQVSGRCWHLYAAALFVAHRWRDGIIPEPAEPASPAAAPPAPVPSPAGAERVPFPPRALAGFYG